MANNRRQISGEIHARLEVQRNAPLAILDTEKMPRDPFLLCLVQDFLLFGN